jgi:alpha-L-fucosidase
MLRNPNFIIHLFIVGLLLQLGFVTGCMSTNEPVCEAPAPDRLEDLSAVPQIHETEAERDERMQWFRDAKFGMFVHWGPCSVGQKEIGWGREANRPWDINRHGPRTADPVYDNYYQQFNPVKYDADAWARFAKESGMKYMVLITKHHDGFSMFDTKLTDYSIMSSAYGRDVVKPFVEACHRHGLKAGLYYSTRDWYHPDYLVGDNLKYDAWYRGQIEELLTNYGEIDIMWFDHVGGRDWGKWRFDKLFSKMYQLQPDLLVNNRAAKFCGPTTPEDRGPATPEIELMTLGDYYTPEGRIGSMDIERDWESCIHVGQGWSYRGEEGFKGPEECIKMLVSCTTGGGNLLLNGTFTEGESAVARAAGAWLGKYGEAIYGTRGGPYRNARWGGSCHKGNKLYLHVYDWPAETLEFDPLPIKVLAARTLDGHPVEIHQDANGLDVQVATAHRADPVTVIELTIEQSIEPGTLYGGTRKEEVDLSQAGVMISANATVTTSSTCVHDFPEDYQSLLTGERPARDYAFHTAAEKNPWATVDLGSVKTVKAIVIENRPNEHRSDGLIMSVSEDGEMWAQVWQAEELQPEWTVALTHFHAGIDVPGREARYLKFETRNKKGRSLLLNRVTVYGDL